MAKSSVKVGRHTIALSNLDKILYPGGPFTKAQVIDYYSRVAPYQLPHLADRPITLVRFPDGVFGESFYEKNAPGFTPDWVKTFPVARTEGGVINYILINDLPTLVWTANLAALELHPFLHRAPAIRTPSYVVFDLDPGEGADILTCAEVAYYVRDLLAKLRLKCFPKVSGSKGIQIYVPLNSPASYEMTHAFARAVAELLSREHPGLILSEMAKVLRAGKVFIDWSQNNQSKTTVGVYSLRAKRGKPFVSVPVKWDELRRACRRSDPESLYFEPDAALARLKKLGDLFAPVLTLKQQLPEEFVKTRPRRTASRPLAQYAAKRNFARTTEPEPVAPRRSAQGSRRRFVVQKHAAQHLHYDFRLEMHDVLKSWAVPKGIPLKLGETRSAFATEDHPVDYLDFEGVIPKGQYGGGTVMVWDIGTYDSLEGNYYAGELKVFLSGRKLRGEWTLKRLKTEDDGDGKPVWLLIKTQEDAKLIARAKADESAVTRRRMEQIAEEKTAVWQSNRAATAVQEDEPTVRKQRSREGAKRRAIPRPGFVPPMKATLVTQLPAGPEWIYEIKWDGYRALAIKHGDEVRLLSLKQKKLDFPVISEAVRGIDAGTAVLDGEIVAVNAQGHPSFQALQNRASLGREWHLVYYAFDLLNRDGKDLTQLPLERRKEELQQLIAGSNVRYSADLPGAPDEIVRHVEAAGLEGVIAKRRDSTYAARGRSTTWQKLKLAQSQEFVVGGYNPEGASFSSLLVGYYEGSRLLFAGKVRQGFNPASRASLMKQLRPLELKRCPFDNLPISRSGHFGEGITRENMATLRWVRPQLVAQVSFTEWTHYGLLRHATFVALREDKEAREIVKESGDGS